MDKIEIKHIDATPDDEYPLRILQAYRDQCNWKWSSSSKNIKANDILLAELNKAQEKRARILDKAIAILKEKQNDSR